MYSILSRILLSFVVFLTASVAVQAGPAGAAESKEQERRDLVSAWLSKMGEALRKESYEGIFTYMRGSRFDTIRVVHRYEDGVEIERLIKLNGEPREVVRHGDEVVCRHEKSETVDLEHDVPLGPFTHAFNENLTNHQSLYEFELEGFDRIANRSALKLAISPKHDDRYGYRLWLDEETGLLLRSNLVSRGRVLEVFQFSQVEIGDAIEPSHFASTLDDYVEHSLTTMEPDGPEVAAAKPQWRVSWLPSGFRQITTRGPNRILYSDGIATFSVFIERGNGAELGEVITHMGGTVVLTRRLKGSAQQITVVGEVPVDTAKKVAASVEPVIY